MAERFAGNQAIDRASRMIGNRTYIIVADGDYTKDSPINGIIRGFDVYVDGNAGTVKLKVFRDDGTNYVYVGESPGITCGSAGLYSGKAFIKVQKGDLIGFYVSATLYGVDSLSSGSDAVYNSGDITSTTLKSDWTATSARSKASITAKIYSRVEIL